MQVDGDAAQGGLAGAVSGALAEATGQHRREDPLLPTTGGPAGNAVLTAWTGLVLLVLSVGELLTLFDVRGLISWHVAIGALLVPPAALKIGSTGWRLVRYYAGNRPYQQAGPPPLLLRILGPLVVISTVTLLASGVLLVLLGEQSSHTVLFTLPLLRVDWVTLHQGSFAVWAVVTGLHLLARIVPALRLTLAPNEQPGVPGRAGRLVLLGGAAVLAVALAVALVPQDGGWSHRHDFRLHDHRAAARHP